MGPGRRDFAATTGTSEPTIAVEDTAVATIAIETCKIGVDRSQHQRRSLAT